MIAEDIQSVLRQQPLGLLFDIDGTLSPIAPTPDAAVLYPGATELLQQASQFAHVGILTGRSVADGARMVNVEGITYIGTHGLEWCAGLPATHPVQLIEGAQKYIEPGKYLLDLVQRELSARIPGLLVEYKSVGGTIHYRLAPAPDQAHQQILALLQEPAQALNMKLVDGKFAVEIRVPLATNKGEALRRFANHFSLRGSIFAGDDRTDLDAMLESASLRQEGYAAHSIVVRHQDTLPALLTQADTVVLGVEGMVQLLKEMLNYLNEETAPQR